MDNSKLSILDIEYLTAMDITTLRNSLIKIDELLSKSHLDKTIDRKDLLAERRNCLMNIKKLKKLENKNK